MINKKYSYKILGLVLLLGIMSYAYFNYNIIQPNPTTKPITNTSLEQKTPIDQESCISCHHMEGEFSPFHEPKLIGCVSCHLGDASSSIKDTAHQHMIKIPGNLSDAARTCGKCHPNQLHNIQHSLMTTNSGIVAIDKYIFGESDSPNKPYHIKELKGSPSDSHLRQLCANCHLGSDKKTYGAISELSRGGGCNACHLNYSEKAQDNLYQYKIGKIEIPSIHPSTDIHITNTHCYGCHSRSSRISTNYMGLHETLKSEEDVIDNNNYTIAQDGRVYSHQQADIHHNKGLLCIDCHTSQEVMGDGNDYLHEEDAVKVQCSDCHFKNKPSTTLFDQMDAESQLVFMVRNYLHEDKKILMTQDGNIALVNTYLDRQGNAFLISKKDSSIHPIIAQGAVCSRDNAHQNLSCSACHTSWAPRCIACHTDYESKGEAYDLLDKKEIIGKWVEYVDGFNLGPPSLGVSYTASSKRIIPAVPGMIMTLDQSGFDGDKKQKFHRLFAPNAPHTTQKNARTCSSCHRDPITLGYGEGSLIYQIKESDQNGRKTKYGEWAFEASYEAFEEDGLPQDAWISFMEKHNKDKTYSTRLNFRPFNRNEQKDILLVGSCLECHKEDSDVMKESLDIGIKRLIQKKSEACVLPL